MGTNDDLIQAVKSGDIDLSVEKAKSVLAEGVPAAEVANSLTQAIREVGDAFERFDIFLPELMMTSDAMVEVMRILEPKLKEEGSEAIRKATKVVMASVNGDIHEIGKNIVMTLFNAHGYDVLDLGADVDSLEIVKVAQREKAEIIGLSALMTTTMLGQKEVVNILKDMGLRDKFKVIIGGAPTNEEWAESIEADGWARDASSAVRVAEKLIG